MGLSNAEIAALASNMGAATGSAYSAELGALTRVTTRLPGVYGKAASAGLAGGTGLALLLASWTVASDPEPPAGSLEGLPAHPPKNDDEGSASAPDEAGAQPPGLDAAEPGQGSEALTTPIPETPRVEVEEYPDQSSDTGGSVLYNDNSWIPDEVTDKLPESWGAGLPTRKGVGTRWFDPSNKGNGVRIDKGNPNANWPSQKVDHVIVNSGGKVIGRDGKPIKGSIDDDPVNAHIPLSEYKKWKNWNSPDGT